MVGDENRQGVFAVGIESDDGKVSVVLSGKHYFCEERDMAKLMSERETRKSMSCGASPVYLVKDSVVEIAEGASDKVQMTSVSGCHDGPRGKPCGECEKCRRAAARLFTMPILAGIEIPGGDLAERLRKAVFSTLGFTTSHMPWSPPMTKAQVESVFMKLGVKPVKQGEE